MPRSKETLTRDDFAWLLGSEATVCLSLYMPTHRTGGPEHREDAIRFSNLIRKTEEVLRERDVRGLALQDVTEFLAGLQKDAIFWQNQSDGLAIFAEVGKPDGLREARRLPLRFDERCIAADRFEIRPLLPLLQGDGRFYVLAASQNRVRLLEGTRFGVHEIEDDRLPTNMRDALNIDEYVRSLQFNSFRGAGGAEGGRGAAAYHGHGGGDMDVKKSDELLPYFRKIDDALGELFGVERAPLVFAGVDYLFPIFREACHYDGLVSEPLTGNFDAAKPQELHDRAWPLIEARFRTALDAELDRLGAAGAKLASHDAEEIGKAAEAGRIETLLLADGTTLHGRPIDTAAGTGSLAQKETRAVGDPLNRAAVLTLQTGGRVYSVPRERMPMQADVAARFRYAADTPAK